MKKSKRESTKTIPATSSPKDAENTRASSPPIELILNHSDFT